MSLVDIRVDLPTHSHSFTVSVPSNCSVLQVKQEIYGICPGQPRPGGQRLIWGGRLLSDDETVESLWKTGPRIVHLAVHPSAWSSKPPEIQPVQHAPSRPRAPSTSSVTPEHSHQSLRPVFAYVAYQHQKALSSLSSSIPIPNELETPELHRWIAKNELKRSGWSWPDVLDAEFPPPSEPGLLYVYAYVNGQPYLRLLDPGAKPTARQEHSLRVLTYTFTILHMSIPLPPPVGNTTQSISVPPHVNQLLQQMGLAPLRVVNDNMIQAVANQHNPVPPDIREIPLRPLLAPLVMLVLRSMLLLYFVAPARKPVIGILIFAWMVYEIWQSIRNGLRNGWGVVQGQQQQGDNVARQNNVAQPNANPGWQPGVNLPGRPNIMAGTLDQQVDAFVDGLANMNISDEEILLNTSSGTPAPEPGVGRRIATFVGLLVSTLHPAIWNRRRVALRRREGTIRTEANARDSTLPAESSDSDNGGEIRAQVRDELRARFESQPRWMQRYIQRVMDEDWVDDSD